MAEIVLFHHVLGVTPGVHAFADRLRAGGHTVHVPDLFGGLRFDAPDEGRAHVREVGLADVVERGRRAVADLREELVYAGFSLGVLPAQALAQQRAGARGALLLHGCVPPEEFGGDWPAGVPVQVHGMDRDPSFADEGDLEAARALVAGRTGAELFLYAGDRHLFTDSSLADHDARATDLLVERVLRFLGAVDRTPSSGR